MKWVLIIIAAVVLSVLKNKYFKKLDREQEEYLKKDGHATYIRSHWPNLIEQVVSISGLSISKERNDAVIIGDTNATKIYFGQDLGRLAVVYIRKGQVIQQWKFDQSSSAQDIINQIYQYIRP